MGCTPGFGLKSLRIPRAYMQVVSFFLMKISGDTHIISSGVLRNVSAIRTWHFFNFCGHLSRINRILDHIGLA